MCAIGFTLRQPDGRMLTAEEASGKIASDLAREPLASARSWNVAIPPCFGETAFVRSVTTKLRESESRPVVARIEPDTMATLDDLIADLHDQWSPVLTDDPFFPGGGSQAAILKSVFGRLPPDRRAILVMNRFHKVLELADSWFLGALRSAEEMHNLRILTIAPLSLDAFQRLDSHHRMKLTISNFGDTHSKCVVAAPSWEACAAELATAGIAEQECRWIYDLCGGFPDCINAITAEAGNGMRCDRESRESVRHVHRLIDDKLQYVVQALRRLSHRNYFDALVNYYHDEKREENGQVLTTHEWQGILLDEQGELRAERLGAVAAAESMRLAVEDGQVGQTQDGILGRAQTLYLQRQYENAVRFLRQHAERISHTARGILLMNHAGIMAMLYQGEGLGEDIDWRAVEAAVGDATERLRDLPKRDVGRFGAEILGERYAQIGEVAGRMADCIDALDKKGGGRLFRHLLAPTTGSESDARLMCLLLVLRYEAGLRCHGKTAACQAVLPLPEQAYRLWANWAVGIEHSVRPDPQADEWHDVEQAWQGGNPFVRVDDKGHFKNFRSLAMYALARYLRSTDARGRAPEEALNVLNERLTFFEEIRNGRAHELTYTRQETRERFFALIDRWVEAAVSACPCTVTRGDLTDIVAPLPILDEQGALLHAE